MPPMRSHHTPGSAAGLRALTTHCPRNQQRAQLRTNARGDTPGQADGRRCSQVGRRAGGQPGPQLRCHEPDQTPGQRLFARAPVEDLVFRRMGPHDPRAARVVDIPGARAAAGGVSPAQGILHVEGAALSHRIDSDIRHGTGGTRRVIRCQDRAIRWTHQRCSISQRMPQLEPGIIHRAPHSRTAIECDESSHGPGRCGALRPRAIHLVQANGMTKIHCAPGRDRWRSCRQWNRPRRDAKRQRVGIEARLATWASGALALLTLGRAQTERCFVRDLAAGGTIGVPARAARAHDTAAMHVADRVLGGGRAVHIPLAAVANALAADAVGPAVADGAVVATRTGVGLPRPADATAAAFRNVNGADLTGSGANRPGIAPSVQAPAVAITERVIQLLVGFAAATLAALARSARLAAARGYGPAHEPEGCAQPRSTQRPR